MTTEANKGIQFAEFVANKTHSFTQKQIATLRLVAQGLSSVEVLRQLQITHKTLYHHRADISLGLRSALSINAGIIAGIVLAVSAKTLSAGDILPVIDPNANPPKHLGPEVLATLSPSEHHVLLTILRTGMSNYSKVGEHFIKAEVAGSFVTKKISNQVVSHHVWASIDKLTKDLPDPTMFDLDVDAAASWYLALRLQQDPDFLTNLLAKPMKPEDPAQAAIRSVAVASRRQARTTSVGAPATAQVDDDEIRRPIRVVVMPTTAADIKEAADIVMNSVGVMLVKGKYSRNQEVVPIAQPEILAAAPTVGELLEAIRTHIGERAYNTTQEIIERYYRTRKEDPDLFMVSQQGKEGEPAAVFIGNGASNWKEEALLARLVEEAKAREKQQAS